jgi:hypothetical protein
LDRRLQGEAIRIVIDRIDDRAAATRPGHYQEAIVSFALQEKTDAIELD